MPLITPRPPSDASSIRTEKACTTPPHRSTSWRVASAVPPVARTSSTTSTRSPEPMASSCISRVAAPYSSAYETAYDGPGSLPALRTGTNPAPRASATGAARMKPLASMATTPRSDEKNAPRLHADDLVHDVVPIHVPVCVGERLDDGGEAVVVGEQGR